MRSVSRHLALGAFLALGSSAPSTHGDESNDPSLGRVDGDVGVVAGLGGALGPSGARALAEVRLRYLESAGLFATYEDGSLLGGPPQGARAIATGLELRPLFLYRWLDGHETRRARLDLAIDSLGLELGAWFPQASPGSGFVGHPGFELGLGLEIPVGTSATGVWVGLHGGVRWGDRSLGAGVADTMDERAAFLAVTLAWHQIFAAHLVDVGDRAPR